MSMNKESWRSSKVVATILNKPRSSMILKENQKVLVLSKWVQLLKLKTVSKGLTINSSRAED
jgi:hypothetical protein